MDDKTPSEAPQLDEFLTVQEVADLLKVKPSTIYEMVASRSIPFIRFGRKGLRFSTKVLEKWLQILSVNPTSEEKEIQKKIKSLIKEKPPLNIYQIAKKNIAEVRGKEYTSPREKPDKDRGLGKEVDHGNL